MVFELKSLIALRLTTWYGHEVVLSAAFRGPFGAFMSSSMAEKRDPDTAMTKSGKSSAHR